MLVEKENIVLFDVRAQLHILHENQQSTHISSNITNNPITCNLCLSTLETKLINPIPHLHSK